MNIHLDTELIFKTSRSGGSGGQNVNKVSTKVELNFHVENSQILNEDQKKLIKERLGNRINKQGYVQVISQVERTQLKNKTAVIKKFYQLIEKALKVQKKRKATKPSKSAKEKRLNTKKRDSAIKKLRAKFND